MPIAQEAPMKFKKLLGALAVSLVPAAAAAQSGKLTASYGVQKYVCASYWNPNPRARLCYEGDDVNLGFFLPPSRNVWKFALGNEKDDEEAGVYFNKKKGPVTLGASVEYIEGTVSGEAHMRMDAGSNKVFRDNRMFLAYGNTNRVSTFTAADFFNIGKYHFGIGTALRDRELDKGLKIPFRGKNQVRAYAARENAAKFFYANDGNSQSLSGFVRTGSNYRPYETAGLDADRFDFFQQASVHSQYWLFHPILPAQNTHLSEQGAVAFAPRFSRNKETRTEAYGIDGFYTYENFVGGYGFEKSVKNGEKSNRHRISAGTVIGPARVIGSWDGRDFSVSGVWIWK